MAGIIKIEDFDQWDEVYDYESDESTVVLLDKNGNSIAECGYGGFDGSDFYNFTGRYSDR